jgi:outer membrane lipoprotein-sorting protein
MAIVALAVMGAAWIMTAAHAGFELPTSDQVVAKVKEVYAGHCCFQAMFDQITVNVAMDMRDRFQGMMYVKKPGLIAMDVVFPEKQHVVVQGRSYSVYFPEERNAVRGEVPPEINVEHFFNFFANISNIGRDFTVSYPTKAFSLEEGLIFLELHDAKNPRGTYRIVLGVDSTTYIIRRAVIYDALGNYNRFHLSKVKFLDAIPDSRFRTEYEGTTTVPESPLQFFNNPAPR